MVGHEDIGYEETLVVALMCGCERYGARYRVALVEGGRDFTYRVTVGGTHNSEARKEMRARNDQRNMDFYTEHYRAHFANITARIRRR